MHKIPNDLAKSLIDSVFPVAVGPDETAPIFIFNAPVMVNQHLSVRFVIINLDVAPKYSYPYFI